MMQDARYNPLSIENLLNQLTLTTDQSLIHNISINVERAIREYLPFDMIKPLNLIMSRFLVECLRNSNDANFDSLIINTLKSYAFDEGAVTLLKTAMLDE